MRIDYKIMLFFSKEARKIMVVLAHQLLLTSLSKKKKNTTYEMRFG
jgi:hypothetical protein